MVSDMVLCKGIMENKLYTVSHKVGFVLFSDTFLFFLFLFLPISDPLYPTRSNTFGEEIQLSLEIPLTNKTKKVIRSENENSRGRKRASKMTKQSFHLWIQSCFSFPKRLPWKWRGLSLAWDVVKPHYHRLQSLEGFCLISDILLRFYAPTSCRHLYCRTGGLPEMSRH